MTPRPFRWFAAIMMSLTVLFLSAGTRCYEAAAAEIAAGRASAVSRLRLNLFGFRGTGRAGAAIEPGGFASENMTQRLRLNGDSAIALPSPLGFDSSRAPGIETLGGAGAWFGVKRGGRSAGLPRDGPSNRLTRWIAALQVRVSRFGQANEGSHRALAGAMFGENAPKGGDAVGLAGAAVIAAAPGAFPPGNGLGRWAPGVSRRGIRAPLAPKIARFCASTREHISWIASLLRLVADSGLDIKKKLMAASSWAVAMAALSPATVYLYARSTAHIQALSQGMPQGYTGWLQALLGDAALRDFSLSALAMIAVYAAAAVCKLHFVKATHEIGNRLMHVLSIHIAKQALDMPLQWHREHPPGDMMSLADGSLERLQSVVTNAAIKPFQNGIVALVSAAGMLMLCGWHVFVIALPFMILGSVPSLAYQRLISRVFSRFYCEGKPSVMRALSAALGNVKHIKAAGVEGFAVESVAEASRKAHLEMGGDVVRALAPFMAFKDLAANLGHFGVLAAVALAGYFHYGDLNLWQGLGFLMLAHQQEHAVQELCAGFMELARGSGVAGRLRSLQAGPQGLNAKPEGALPPAEGGREIRLKYLRFGYAQRPVLEIDDLRFERGKTTAVVGLSGLGKSTLLGLISGLERPEEGAVFIDAIDARDLGAGQLRKEVLFVPQEAEPFDGDVARNIASGRLDVPLEQVQQAARAVGLHEDILRLGGYGVRVGQNGVNLSAGQKKRLALARAWLRLSMDGAPSVVLLDEPTDSLDPENAQRVLAALEPFRGRSTTIVVTHDARVMRTADRIVALEKGKAAERGLQPVVLRYGNVEPRKEK